MESFLMFIVPATLGLWVAFIITLCMGLAEPWLGALCVVVTCLLVVIVSCWWAHEHDRK